MTSGSGGCMNQWVPRVLFAIANSVRVAASSGWRAGGVALLVLVALVIPRPSHGQECPGGYDQLGTPIATSITIADGSTPPPGSVAGVSRFQGGDYVDGPYVVPIGGGLIDHMKGDGAYEFEAGVANTYFLHYPAGSATCTELITEDEVACYRCDGMVTAKLYATQGAYEGLAVIFPQGIRASLQTPVAVQDVGGGAFHTLYTDAAGHFEERAMGEPFRSNYWGVNVFCDGDHGETRCQTHGIRDIELTLDGLNWTPIQLRSSTLKSVQLSAKAQDVEEPNLRDPDSCSSNSPSDTPGTNAPGASNPNSDVGRPVNVISGNVWFDQTDARIPGVAAAGLLFIRSYNSLTRQPGQYGIFGPGWTHTYEQHLKEMSTEGALMLRTGNGTPTYFYWDGPQANSSYHATLPVSDKSTIQKVGADYTRTFREGGSETYHMYADGYARLTSVADAAGNITTLERNAAGKLLSVTDPGSRSITLQYSAGGLLASLQGPMSVGAIATYGYENNMLKTVTYPDGSGYTFTYDPTTLALLSVMDHSGRFVEKHTYSAGKAETSEIANGREKLTLTYGPGVTTVRDALDHVTTYEWAEFWGMKRVTKITGPCPSCGGEGSETREWAYDEKGRITAYTDGAGQTTTYTYDDDTGNLISSKDALEHETTYTYYPDGRLQKREQPSDLGTARTEFTYDDLGPATISVLLDGSGHVRTTTIDYNGQGKPWHITDPSDRVTTLQYDSLGDLRRVTNPISKHTDFTYDLMGRRKTVEDHLDNVTETTYDGHGRVTQINDPLDHHTDFTYDLGGRRTSVTDPLGRITHYEYDGYGRLETVRGALSAVDVTTYAYDVMSQLTSITDARGKTTTFEPDAFGRTRKVTYPGNRAETFTYDTAGHLATRTDRNGVVTTYTYDELGRLKEKRYSDDTPMVTFTYDDLGRLWTAANDIDTLTFTYNLAGQLLTESSSKNGSDVGYTYYIDGSRETISLNDVLFLEYEPDDAGRPWKIKRGTDTFVLGYDDVSRRASVDYPNSTRILYQYDEASQLLGIGTKLGGSFLTSSTYTYDSVGNRLTKSGDFNEAYAYDSGNRLTQVKRGTPVTENYAYDLVGNRLSSIQYGDWSYTDRNELESYGPATFVYDLNGNMTEKHDPSGDWIYEWNAESQLIRVGRDGQVVARFSYDPIGRRVEKVAGTVTTAYIYDGEDVLGEEASGAAYRYIHGPGIDEPLARVNASGGVTFLHTDGLGSIVGTTNQSGAFTGLRRYDAFGNPQVGASVAGYAFTGREWDPEAGLYYYRARYYDPKIGRFLSEDPLFWIDTPNLYAYVGNNSVNYTDPSGEAAVKNNSGGPIPVKPESGNDFRLCMPGQTCDVDGVYPPECKDYPIKVVDACTGEVTPDGKLKIVCPLFDRNAPGLRKFPRFGQRATGGSTNKDFHDEHKDWPPPNNQPNCGCKTPY